MTISELRDKRANLWKSMTAFLDTRTGSDGVLSAEDDASYAKMEKDFDALTNEIRRMERKDALEAEMNKPIGTPITEKPMGFTVHHYYPMEAKSHLERILVNLSGKNRIHIRQRGAADPLPKVVCGPSARIPPEATCADRLQ